MKIKYSLILVSMLIANKAEPCEIKGSILICKEGTPETHNCTQSNMGHEVLSFTHKYTCSEKESTSQREKSRFKVTTRSASWISETRETVFPISNLIDSKICEIKDNDQALECYPVKAYKCDESKKDRVLAPSTQKYICTQRFKVDGENKYSWKIKRESGESISPPPSPPHTSTSHLDELLDRLRALIQEVQRALQERKISG